MIRFAPKQETPQAKSAKTQSVAKETAVAAKPVEKRAPKRKATKKSGGETLL